MWNNLLSVYNSKTIITDLIAHPSVGFDPIIGTNKVPHLKPAIKRYVRESYWYCMFFIKCRCIEFEEIIKTSTFYSYQYCKYVIKGRCEEFDFLLDSEYKSEYVELPYVE